MTVDHHRRKLLFRICFLALAMNGVSVLHVSYLLGVEQFFHQRLALVLRRTFAVDGNRQTKPFSPALVRHRPKFFSALCYLFISVIITTNLPADAVSGIKIGIPV